MNYQDLLHSPLLPSQIIALVKKASRTRAPILIQGERGTGKELIAKIIHYTGEWKHCRLHKTDCKILSEDAFANQLSLLFKAPPGGATPVTLFLKEVGALSHADQFKLLELMEGNPLQKGPEEKAIKTLRFIASSSEDLEEKVSQGRFSEDLHDRFKIVVVRTLPLRDRVQDIPVIAKYLLDEHAKRIGIKNVEISHSVNKLLKDYWWPGNLKELEQVLVRSAILSEGGDLRVEDLLVKMAGEKNGFASFAKRADLAALSNPGESSFSKEDKDPLWPFFLMELVHRIKNPLVSIKTFTQLLEEKFDDREYRDHFYRVVNEDIERIDSVLNHLLDFIRLNSPMSKANTVHVILEETLKNHELELETKKIKVRKRLEQDLPETTLHDEQLKYIFGSILQVIISSIPPKGTIGLLTRSSSLPKAAGESQSSTNKDGNSIEVLIAFTGSRKPLEDFEAVMGFSIVHKEEAMNLELRLVKEIVEKHHGTMNFQVNEKRPRTRISLSFPIERRRMIYYPSNKA